MRANGCCRQYKLLVRRQILLDLGVTMSGGKKHNPWTILYSVHRVDCSLRVPSDGVQVYRGALDSQHPISV